jgi:hypothetical protein
MTSIASLVNLGTPYWAAAKIQDRKGTEQVSESIILQADTDLFQFRKNLILTSFSLGDGGVGHDDGEHTWGLGDGFQMNNTDTTATDDTDLDDPFVGACFCGHGERRARTEDTLLNRKSHGILGEEAAKS